MLAFLHHCDGVPHIPDIPEWLLSIVVWCIKASIKFTMLSFHYMLQWRQVVLLTGKYIC